ncbi:MAG: 2,3-bisphosphoglycerate-independent phosphoglycerate mutase [Bacteroidales bacterium]|nr:2,3-bisphosphoglycerate-independent phosphoglycerate mutase [Bacteroidales bacterium]
MNKKAILMIMDGWGQGKKDQADAIFQSDTKFIKSLYHQPEVAHALLNTDGEQVGLPDGQMGNSEVGHLNIGSGRIVFQDLVRINNAIKDRSIEDNEEINKAFQYAKENNSKVHFLGLVSDGGVHASTSHLVKLCKMADEASLQNVFIHALMDGRDTDPRSGLGYMKELEENIEGVSAKIATVCGRYYTMDRDKRWDRVKLGYDLMTKAAGSHFKTASQAIESSYANDLTDEFVKPSVIVDEQNNALASISENDVVFCFNFRTDRLREITTVLSQQDMEAEGMKTIPLYYVTMTKYDESFKNVHIAFNKDDLKNTMGEIISKAGKTQVRIAETEKYAHVTFFFSGGREKEYEGEKRILVPSPKVATYDLQPSMSAFEVTDKIVKELKDNQPDLVVLNFANSDMVGHTGIYEAIQEAVETVDQCVEKVSNTARELGYTVMITADHGNSDHAINADGSPNTAHSMNPVPVFLLDDHYDHIKNGKLADIAPTLLKIMDLEIPKEMTGEVLV